MRLLKNAWSVFKDWLKPVQTLLCLTLILPSTVLAQSITLAMSGKESTLESHLLKDKPNVLLFIQFGCSFSCNAIVRQFRKVLSESGLTLGEDLNVITIGFGAQDTWQLGRQRALKVYERFPDRENIENRWVFAVSGDNTLFEKFELSKHTPKLVLLTKEKIISKVFTHQTLSTESFIRSIKDASDSKVSYYTLSGEECPESLLKPSTGLLAMRVGVVASLMMFFGLVFFLVRRS